MEFKVKIYYKQNKIKPLLKHFDIVQEILSARSPLKKNLFELMCVTCLKKSQATIDSRNIFIEHTKSSVAFIVEKYLKFKE